MKKTFSISEALKFGWNTFKSNWKFWIIVTLLVGIGRVGGVGTAGRNNNFNLNNYKNNQTIEQTVEESTSLISKNISNSVLGAAAENDSKEMGAAVKILVGTVATITGAFMVTLMLLTILAGVVFKMGHINLLLDTARGKEPYYKTLLNQVSFKKALRFLAAAGLSGLLIVLGYILFIIPGILLTFKYMFVPFVVVDEDPGILESLKRSSQITKGVRFKLFLYSLAMFGLSIVGLLAFGVGFYIVTIVGSLAFAYIYVKVLKQEKTKTSKSKKAR